VCTFLFSILVLFSTLNILKDTLRVLMEGTPKHINYEAVKADLVAMEGVKHAHSLQIWSLTLNRTALAVHLALEPGADNQDVLERASCMLKERYGINQTTLQVEAFQPTMEACRTCQNVSTPTRVDRIFKLRRNSSPSTSNAVNA
jgi:zinc transporter 2